MAGGAFDDGKSALVLGANGQDGTYLVRHLRRRGYRVTGVGRSERFNSTCDNYRYLAVDLRDQVALASVLKSEDPGLIFHAAAIHSSAAGSAATKYEENFPTMLAVNTASAQTVAEHFRVNRPDGRFVYISSGKMFGPTYPTSVSEGSPQFRKCLYTVTKGAAGDAIIYYRERHNIQSSIVFPFAHESSLRPPEFFISKLVNALTAARGGAKTRTALLTLDFAADWGNAEEYMDICIDVAERAIGEDFVLGRGKNWYARDLARYVFAAAGLDYRDFLDAPPPAAVPAPFSVSNCKLLSIVGRTPQLDIADSIIARAGIGDG